MGYLNRKKLKDATKRASWREIINDGSKEPTFDEAYEEWSAKTDKFVESLRIPREETENGDKMTPEAFLNNCYTTPASIRSTPPIPDPNEAFKSKKLVASLTKARHAIRDAEPEGLSISTTENVAIGCSAGSIGTTVIGTNYSGSTLLSDDEE